MRILASLLLVGCGSYTTYQTAEPLGTGRWQASLAADAGGFRDGKSGTRTPTATAELALHRGITDTTDLGLKLYGLGVEGQVKHRFVDGRWQWAVAGALGGVRTPARAGFTDAFTGHLRVTAIATRRTSSRWAWSLGPVATASLFYPAGGGTAGGLLAGAFANAEWTFGGCWRLVPELSLHGMVAGEVPVDGGGVVLAGLAVARRW